LADRCRNPNESGDRSPDRTVALVQRHSNTLLF
jgi:hypothetical protein